MAGKSLLSIGQMSCRFSLRLAGILILLFTTVHPAFSMDGFPGAEGPEEPPADSVRKIEIIGSITHKRDQLTGSSIAIYEGNKLLMKRELGNSASFTIYLDVEKLFRLEISKPDFQPKVFRMATYMWNSNEDLFPVEMYVDLFAKEELKSVENPDHLTGVTTLYYNPKRGYFENNEPRSFVMKERFKALLNRMKQRASGDKKKVKKGSKKQQLKLPKSRPDRLSKYNS